MRKLIIIAFAIAAFGLFSAMNGFSQKGHTFRKGYKISKIKANPERIAVQVGKEFKEVEIPLSYFVIASDTYPVTLKSKIEVFQVNKDEWEGDIHLGKKVFLTDLSAIWSGL